MSVRWMTIGAVGLALAGCATRDRVPPPAPSASGETITYSTGRCFGACPAFTVTIASSGRGTFTGQSHTAVQGARSFTATPRQYAAFAAALAPYRPNGEALYQPGSKLCGQVATDMPSVDVRWQGGSRRAAHLYYYYGCDMQKNAKMGDALGNAIDLLPVEPLIGPRP